MWREKALVLVAHQDARLVQLPLLPEPFLPFASRPIVAMLSIVPIIIFLYLQHITKIAIQHSTPIIADHICIYVATILHQPYN